MTFMRMLKLAIIHSSQRLNRDNNQKAKKGKLWVVGAFSKLKKRLPPKRNPFY